MTRTITVFLAEAFTTEPGKGNRAGVVLDAAGLSDAAMQVVADRSVSRYLGRQGVAMGREGVIEVTVTRDSGGPHKVQVGGTAVEAGRMEIEMSDENNSTLATVL